MDNISILKFSKFIIKVLGNNISPNSLVSYAFRPDEVITDTRLRRLAKEYEKSFYWEKPAESTAWIGLGELISFSESGKGRFAATEKKIRHYHDNFLSNWDELGLKSVPLFMGGMKFAPENENEIWENYSDSLWFVPKIMILRQAEEYFIIYNFILSPETDKQKIINDIQLKVNPIFVKAENGSGKPAPRIISCIGNSPKDKKKWTENVKKALSILEGDEIKKMVLSRFIELTLDEEPEVFTLIEQLKNKYPDCYLFAFHSAKSTFFGASPEKLLRIDSGWLETDALAGSAPRGTDQTADRQMEEELLHSQKNLFEHNTVVKFIKNVFSGVAEEIMHSEQPKIKKLHNIQHLWTPIRIKLNPASKLFTILENFHPTPAVCGTPQNEALNQIKKLEDYHRGMYAGIVGWFNFNGQADFSVSIRSALSKGKKLFAFAGCGIVEGSDPASEFKETELKLKPILSLFANENKN